MITKLITLFTCVGACLLNAPIEKKVVIDYHDTNDSQPFYNRNCQHSVPISSYVNVNYKYETNEVNSIDDLIEYNIYNFNFPNDSISWDFGMDYRFRFKIISGTLLINYEDRESDEFFDNIILSSNSSLIEMNCYDNDDTYQLKVYNGDYYNDEYYSIILYDFSISQTNLVIQFFSIDYESQLDFYYSFLSSTTYNEIVSVDYIQPTTFLGYINEFLEEYLYRDLPLVQAMIFEIGGQQVNLMTWLILITGLGLCVLFIFIIINIIKWLIKIFTNGLLLK